jgi:hypothetical protein
MVFLKWKLDKGDRNGETVSSYMLREPASEWIAGVIRPHCNDKKTEWYLEKMFYPLTPFAPVPVG